jgi:hypothetical protein
MDIDISGGEELLKAAAEAAGVSMEQYVQSLVRREIIRLGHIERSKPRVLKAETGAGRPPLPPEVKQCREISKHLKDVFLGLQEFYGAEYVQLFGKLDDKLTQAIAENDLHTLLWFQTEQPWVRR